MTAKRRDAAYWRGRVEREYPEIAQRLETGEIPSVRAAAIEAGLIHDPTPLAELRRAWRKAAPEERTAFLAEITLATRAQPIRMAEEARRQAVQGGRNQGELFSVARPGASGAPGAAVSVVIDHRADWPGRLSGGPAAASGSAPRAAGPGGPGERLEAPTRRQVRPASKGGRRGLGRLLGLRSSESASADDGDDADAAAAASGVQLGQRFAKLDAGPTAWEVLSIFSGPHGVPHARIACVEEPDTVRVVSLAALTDARRYRPL